MEVRQLTGTSLSSDSIDERFLYFSFLPSVFIMHVLHVWYTYFVFVYFCNINYLIEFIRPNFCLVHTCITF